MTESNTKPQSILLRVEMVRARMHSWGLTSGDAGYIDPADPATLDPADSSYVRADLASVSAYYDRIRAEADARLSRTTSTRYGAAPASEPLQRLAALPQVVDLWRESARLTSNVVRNSVNWTV
jgi:hypothetical protein